MGIVEIQKPMTTEAFQANAGIKALDISVVGRFARAAEIKRDAVGICPLIEFLRRKLTPVVDPDGVRNPNFRRASPNASMTSVAVADRQTRITGQTRLQGVNGGQDP
jgi:hypothetical protein